MLSTPTGSQQSSFLSLLVFIQPIQHLYPETLQPLINLPFPSATPASRSSFHQSLLILSTPQAPQAWFTWPLSQTTNKPAISLVTTLTGLFSPGARVLITLHQEVRIPVILAVFYFSTVRQPLPGSENQDGIIEHFKIQLSFPKLIVSEFFLFKINGSSNYCLPRTSQDIQNQCYSYDISCKLSISITNSKPS